MKDKTKNSQQMKELWHTIWEQIALLGWDRERMSQGGQETYSELLAQIEIFKDYVEPTDCPQCKEPVRLLEVEGATHYYSCGHTAVDESLQVRLK